MNDPEVEKIKRFVADEVMFESIRRFFEREFMKPIKETDVQYLAANRIALDLIGEAFKDLERYKEKKLLQKGTFVNPGV